MGKPFSAGSPVSFLPTTRTSHFAPPRRRVSILWRQLLGRTSRIPTHPRTRPAVRSQPAERSPPPKLAAPILQTPIRFDDEP